MIIHKYLLEGIPNKIWNRGVENVNVSAWVLLLVGDYSYSAAVILPLLCSDLKGVNVREVTGR